MLPTPALGAQTPAAPEGGGLQSGSGSRSSTRPAPAKPNSEPRGSAGASTSGGRLRLSDPQNHFGTNPRPPWGCAVTVPARRRLPDGQRSNGTEEPPPSNPNLQLPTPGLRAQATSRHPHQAGRHLRSHPSADGRPLRSAGAQRLRSPRLLAGTSGASRVEGGDRKGWNASEQGKEKGFVVTLNKIKTCGCATATPALGKATGDLGTATFQAVERSPRAINNPDPGGSFALLSTKPAQGGGSELISSK